MVERLRRLPRRPAATVGPAQLRAVEGVQRLAGLEHHVVGDVDGERHRAHADIETGASSSTATAPSGRSRRSASVNRSQPSRSSTRTRAACPPLGPAAHELGPGPSAVRRTGERQLARDAAHRQVEAHVGRDRELEDGVAGPSTGPASSPTRRCPGGSTMMPSWSSPRPSSRSEQIMPSEMWPVGLARGDRETAGSTLPAGATTTSRPRRRVARAADDPAHAGGVGSGRGPRRPRPAPADRLR